MNLGDTSEVSEGDPLHFDHNLLLLVTTEPLEKKNQRNNLQLLEMDFWKCYHNGPFEPWLFYTRVSSSSPDKSTTTPLGGRNCEVDYKKWITFFKFMCRFRSLPEQIIWKKYCTCVCLITIKCEDLAAVEQFVQSASDVCVQISCGSIIGKSKLVGYSRSLVNKYRNGALFFSHLLK